ncbi:uncharacterized protein LOC144317176 [Canis aureus]
MTSIFKYFQRSSQLLRTILHSCINSPQADLGLWLAGLPSKTVHLETCGQRSALISWLFSWCLSVKSALLRALTIDWLLIAGKQEKKLWVIWVHRLGIPTCLSIRQNVRASIWLIQERWTKHGFCRTYILLQAYL